MLLINASELTTFMQQHPLYHIVDLSLSVRFPVSVFCCTKNSKKSSKSTTWNGLAKAGINYSKMNLKASFHNSLPCN